MVTLPPLPALVPGTVRHQRRHPFPHGLRFKTYQWLFDLDAVPSHGIIASFPVSDHFGGRAGSLREAVTVFAASRDEQVLEGDRLLMLSAGRAFGQAFDPLTVFWCVDAQGQVRWAVLEIHNTYGDRHAHLLHPDDRGQARIPKEFYVSPFFKVEGEYAVTLKLGPERVAVSIQLQQDGADVFSATFTGSAVPATRVNLARAVARTPLMALQTMARIRVHGIWLWLRRLPVVQRPVHDEQVGFL